MMGAQSSRPSLDGDAKGEELSPAMSEEVKGRLARQQDDFKAEGKKDDDEEEEEEEDEW